MKAVILLLVIASALAVPVYKPESQKDQKPGRIPKPTQCSNDIRFREGQRYEYKYQGEAVSGIVGTSEQRSGLKVACSVVIEVPAECELILTTPECVLREADQSRGALKFRRTRNSEEFSRLMAKYPVYFQMNNGKVETVVSYENEPLAIVNIKKGILSALQLQTVEPEPVKKTLEERDVHGVCPSEYTVESHKRGKVFTVSVLKDLTRCTKPQKTSMQGSPLAILKNLTLAADYLLNSTQRCRFDLDGKSQIKGSSCAEVHTYRPFSYNSSRAGAQTNVTQEISLDKVSRINSRRYETSLANRRIIDIVYEFEQFQIPRNKSAAGALEALYRLSNATINETKLEAPRAFADFVSALRVLDNETLSQVLPEMLASKASDQVMQALPQCGTKPCFSAIRQLVTSGFLPKAVAETAVYAMAFLPYPNVDAINETLRVAQYNRSRPAILALSSLVYRYTQNNMTEPFPQPVVEAIEYLRGMIGFDCTPLTNKAFNPVVSAEEQEQILLALKAVGNMGQAVQVLDTTVRRQRLRLVPTLERCIKNQEVPRNITLAAIQAFRRMEINEEIRTLMLDIVKGKTEKQEDAETRIAAYLVLMKNATERELRRVVKIVQAEPIKQVRSFITSHLRNIRATEEPTLQELKQTLEKVLREEKAVLPEPEDFRKYSRSYEVSKAVPLPFLQDPVAAQLQSDIVMDPVSYMPRSALTKMTINVLGQSIELFEAGIEAQGMEHTMEALFGPSGYFPNQALKKMLSPIPYGDKVLKMFGVDSKPKPKFASRQTLDRKIVDGLKKLSDDVKFRKDDLLASSYLRLLGTEVSFMSTEDLKSTIAMALDAYKNSANMMKMLDPLAEGIEKNFTSSYKFLEASTCVPTAMGIPLNVSANGTATTKVTVGGKFDVKKMFYAPRSAVVAGYVRPSASIEVSARMIISLPEFSECGIQANATVHTATEAAGNVTLKEGELKFNIEAPKAPVPIFNMSYQQFLVRPDAIEYIRPMEQDRAELVNCTPSVLGQKICLSLSYSNASYVPLAPYFPMTGDTSFNITMVPTDEIQAFSAAIKYDQEREPIRRLRQLREKRDPRNYIVTDVFRMEVAAPGKSAKRNITSLLQVFRNQTLMQWNLTIPDIYNFTAYLGFQNETVPQVANAYAVSLNLTYREHKNASWVMRYRNESNMHITQNTFNIPELWFHVSNNMSLFWNPWRSLTQFESRSNSSIRLWTARADHNMTLINAEDIFRSGFNSSAEIDLTPLKVIVPELIKNITKQLPKQIQEIRAVRDVPYLNETLLLANQTVSLFNQTIWNATYMLMNMTRPYVQIALPVVQQVYPTVLNATVPYTNWTVANITEFITNATGKVNITEVYKNVTQLALELSQNLTQYAYWSYNETSLYGLENARQYYARLPELLTKHRSNVSGEVQYLKSQGVLLEIRVPKVNTIPGLVLNYTGLLTNYTAELIANYSPVALPNITLPQIPTNFTTPNFTVPYLQWYVPKFNLTLPTVNVTLLTEMALNVTNKTAQVGLQYLMPYVESYIPTQFYSNYYVAIPAIDVIRIPAFGELRGLFNLSMPLYNTSTVVSMRNETGMIAEVKSVANSTFDFYNYTLMATGNTSLCLMTRRLNVSSTFNFTHPLMRCNATHNTSVALWDRLNVTTRSFAELNTTFPETRMNLTHAGNYSFLLTSMNITNNFTARANLSSLAIAKVEHNCTYFSDLTSINATTNFTMRVKVENITKTKFDHYANVSSCLYTGLNATHNLTAFVNVSRLVQARLSHALNFSGDYLSSNLTHNLTVAANASLGSYPIAQAELCHVANTSMNWTNVNTTSSLRGFVNVSMGAHASLENNMTVRACLRTLNYTTNTAVYGNMSYPEMHLNLTHNFTHNVDHWQSWNTSMNTTAYFKLNETRVPLIWVNVTIPALYTNMTHNIMANLTRQSQNITMNMTAQAQQMKISHNSSFCNTNQSSSVVHNTSIVANLTWINVTVPFYNTSVWELIGLQNVSSPRQLQYLNISGVANYTKSQENYTLPIPMLANLTTPNLTIPVGLRTPAFNISIPFTDYNITVPSIKVIPEYLYVPYLFNVTVPRSIPAFSAPMNISIPAPGNFTYSQNVSSPIFNMTYDMNCTHARPQHNRTVLGLSIFGQANSTIEYFNYTYVDQANTSVEWNLTRPFESKVNMTFFTNLTHPMYYFLHNSSIQAAFLSVNVSSNTSAGIEIEPYPEWYLPLRLVNISTPVIKYNMTHNGSLIFYMPLRMTLPTVNVSSNQSVFLRVPPVNFTMPYINVTTPKFYVKHNSSLMANCLNINVTSNQTLQFKLRPSNLSLPFLNASSPDICAFHNSSVSLKVPILRLATPSLNVTVNQTVYGRLPRANVSMPFLNITTVEIEAEHNSLVNISTPECCLLGFYDLAYLNKIIRPTVNITANQTFTAVMPSCNASVPYMNISTPAWEVRHNSTVQFNEWSCNVTSNSSALLRVPRNNFTFPVLQLNVSTPEMLANVTHNATAFVSLWNTTLAWNLTAKADRVQLNHTARVESCFCTSMRVNTTTSARCEIPSINITVPYTGFNISTPAFLTNMTHVMNATVSLEKQNITWNVTAKVNSTCFAQNVSIVNDWQRIEAAHNTSVGANLTFLDFRIPYLNVSIWNVTGMNRTTSYRQLQFFNLSGVWRYDFGKISWMKVEIPKMRTPKIQIPDLKKIQLPQIPDMTPLMSYMNVSTPEITVPWFNYTIPSIRLGMNTSIPVFRVPLTNYTTPSINVSLTTLNISEWRLPLTNLSIPEMRLSLPLELLPNITLPRIPTLVEVQQYVPFELPRMPKVIPSYKLNLPKRVHIPIPAMGNISMSAELRSPVYNISAGAELRNETSIIARANATVNCTLEFLNFTTKAEANLTIPHYNEVITGLSFNHSQQWMRCNFTHNASIAVGWEKQNVTFNHTFLCETPIQQLHYAQNLTVRNNRTHFEVWANETAATNVTLLQYVSLYNISLWDVLRLNETSSPQQLQRINVTTYFCYSKSQETWEFPIFNLTTPTTKLGDMRLNTTWLYALANATSTYMNVSLPYVGNVTELASNVTYFLNTTDQMLNATAYLRNATYLVLNYTLPLVRNVTEYVWKMPYVPSVAYFVGNLSLPRVTLQPKIVLPALGNTTFMHNVSSPVYNLTLDSRVLNTTLVQNKSAIVHLFNCTANSTLDFLNFTMQSYLNVSHAHNLTELNVSASVNLTLPDLAAQVTMNTTGLNVSDIWFTKFNHSLVINVTSHDWVNATVNFTMSNNTVYANLTVPTLDSSVALLAQRNASVLNVTLYHQTKPEYRNITAWQLAVALNRSDAVSFKFRLNPESLLLKPSNLTFQLTKAFYRAIWNESHPINKYPLKYINRTISEAIKEPIVLSYNYSMDYANQTLNVSMQLLNYTVNYVIENYNATVTSALNTTLHLANFTMNYTLELANKTLNYSIESLKNLTFTIPQINVTIKGSEIVGNVTELIQNVTRYSTKLQRNATLLIGNLTELAMNVSYYSYNVSQNVMRNVTRFIDGNVPVVSWAWRYWDPINYSIMMANQTFTYARNVNYTDAAQVAMTISEQAINRTLNYTVEYAPQIAEWAVNKTYETTSYAAQYAADYVIQSSNGSIEFNLYHPLNWTRFDEVPSVSNRTAELLRQTTEMMKTMWRSPMSGMKSMMREIPPFDRTSITFGQHVLTWDERLYDVPEANSDDCVYVLARDFDDGNFTILSSKDGITVQLPTAVVQINKESHVRVDGSKQPTELPYQSEEKNITILRQGPYVNITTRDGVSVRCDAISEICVYNISGWYHNKTLGLLGTNDNEPATDFRRPDGSNTTREDVFVNSYEVTKTKNCKIDSERNIAKGKFAAKTDCYIPESPKCDELFHSKNYASKFSRCFQAVNPEPFRQACKRDSKRCNLKEPKKSICTVTAGYIAACEAKGIQIEQTEVCASCEEDKQPGDRWNRRAARKADVVFVVSESRKMKDRYGKPEEQLLRLAEAVEKNLGQNKFKDVQFGIVAFAGKDVRREAHIQTIKGELFKQYSQLQRGLNELRFEGEEPMEAFEAIKLASRYPFRAEAAKTIIVFDHEESLYYEELAEVVDVLEENSITMNVVCDYAKIDRISKKKNSPVVGLTGKGVVLREDKKGKSKSKYAEKLSLPAGQYVKLAKTTGGSIFSLDTFLKGHRDASVIISEQISEQLQPQVEPSAKKQCVCVRGINGEGVTKCRAVY
ncbi:APOB [Branchiostoma lanceolatum]|uniref:APOB protein n=1 Tax=Branchiostoma lanceolatum TaxID=7740 RepID=A0A8K0ECJ8_BRALA|nr:APOB [Branchiostoma lanceolatum]